VHEVIPDEACSSTGVALLTFLLGVGLSPIHFYVEGMGCGKVIDGGGAF